MTRPLGLPGCCKSPSHFVGGGLMAIDPHMRFLARVFGKPRVKHFTAAVASIALAALLHQQQISNGAIVAGITGIVLATVVAWTRLSWSDRNVHAPLRRNLSADSVPLVPAP